MGLNSPFLWRGLWICLEEGEGYTHWSCARVWRRHGDPRLRPQTGGAQVITEVMCCESGKKLVSSVSSAGHQPYPDQTVPQRRSVLLLPVRVQVVTRCCVSLGLYCLPHEHHSQTNFCLNA